MVLNDVILVVSLIFELTIIVSITIGYLVRWLFVLMMLLMMFLVVLLVSILRTKLNPRGSDGESIILDYIVVNVSLVFKLAIFVLISVGNFI